MDISGISGITLDSAAISAATESLSSTTAELEAAMAALATGVSGSTLPDHIGQSLDVVA